MYSLPFICLDIAYRLNCMVYDGAPVLVFVRCDLRCVLFMCFLINLKSINPMHFSWDTFNLIHTFTAQKPRY